MMSEISRRFGRQSLWGLRRAPGESVHGRLVEQRWRWPSMVALTGTIPAFYVDMLQALPPSWTAAVYALAALVLASALLHTGWRSRQLARHVAANPLDVLLILGLLAAAVLPASGLSAGALVLRLLVSLLTLVRMVWALQHLITRGGLMYLLFSATVVLGLCGLGFWVLEPRVTNLGDGLWLAFTTAATVGYGDIVPSTPASKIFSVFVVMLGFGVLSLVTAAIATQWVEAEEREIEHEILRDVHRQMDALRAEIQYLRQDLQLARTAPTPAPAPTAAPLPPPQVGLPPA